MKKTEVFEKMWRTRGEGTYTLITQSEEIAKRESISLNQLIRQAVEEYVQRHGAGNNSFQLDKFGITWTKAVSVTKCGFKDCGKTAVGTALYLRTKQTIGLCSVHFTLCQSQGKDLYTDMKWIDTSNQKTAVKTHEKTSEINNTKGCFYS
jgi:hypothetical protein